MTEFVKFPKIPRLEKIQFLITEKIDGTNAQVTVPEYAWESLIVGSRNRVITPGKKTDNYGFAAWVEANEADVRKLGPGTHYGEWWGCGIARGYGLAERIWSLFNIHHPLETTNPTIRQVPVLYHGQLDFFDEAAMNTARAVVENLRKNGSVAKPWFKDPEGVVITIGHERYKYIFDKRGPSPEATATEATE